MRNWLQETSALHRGHPFGAIPLLQNPELLRRMKEKVTIEPTPSMSKATGVPPHVMQLNLMTSLLELCQTTLLRINEQTEVERQTIFEAMEQRILENGQISRHQIVSILDEFRNGIRDDVRQQIESMQAQQGLLNQRNGGDERMPLARNQGTAGGVLFTYHGRFWDVPETFSFPSGT